MTLSLHAAAILFAVALASAVTQGFTGFGFGLMGMAFCTWLLGPQDANVLWTVLAVLLTTLMWFRLRRHARTRLAVYLTAGSILGLPVGLWILANAGEQLLSRLVGAVVLAFASYSLVNPRFKRRSICAAWALPAGAAGGMVSGATSMGGPAAVIFLLILGLDKDETRGTLSCYFTLMIVCKLAMMAGWHGLLRTDHLLWAALLAPSALAGLAVGMYAARFFSSETMRKIICAFLLLPGALLLLR